jgi:UDP-glucose 4-epimerase
VAPRRVLITGVSRFLGGKLAQKLESEMDFEIFGVDLEEPDVPLERTEFVRADIRNPLIVKVVQATGVDTVIHTATVATPARAGGRAMMKEVNVIGAMQLFAACQKTPAVQHFVLKSTTAVYGADPGEPSIFSEEMVPAGSARTGYAKDAWEVENYARNFARRRPDVTLTMLRFANFIGPEIDTPLTRFFSLPIAPTALGYDPRIQFIHETDAVAILERAAREKIRGTFNAAGEGVLYLSQALRMAGKFAVPVITPLANILGSIVRQAGLVDFSPEQLDFLLFGRVADASRLRDVFGYTPAYSTKEAFQDFVGRARIARVFNEQQAEAWERNVYDLVSRLASASGVGREAK